MDRRGFLWAAGVGAVGGGAATYAGLNLGGTTEVDRLRQEARDLRRQVRERNFNVASGGGVNLKRMPHPETGDQTVALHEVWSFDRRHAFCRVDTNPEAFVMPTNELGDVHIEAHSFFMAMEASSIDQFEVRADDDGRRAILRGGIDCSTEVDQAETTLGGRDAVEHATYRVEARDSSVGGSTADARFLFTAFFDPQEAPINHAIFGPEFTFTGEMIVGTITIVGTDT